MLRGAGTELVGLFQKELELCKLGDGERLLLYTDPRYPYPEQVTAAFGAAKALGADVYLMVVPSDTPGISDPMIVDVWKAADMVIAATHIDWMYSDAHNEALASGTRTLMLYEPVSALRRMFPHPDVIRRSYAGADLLREGREIRITSEAGTDLMLRKDGRKAAAQTGISDRPGRWDHWPGGLVACAPLEDSATGTFVIAPGDACLPFGRHAVSKVKMMVEGGSIVKIEGGYDALLLRDYLGKFDDPSAYKISHVGWGTDQRADWRYIGMDSENFYGSLMIAIGSNMFNAADEYSGMGGSTYTKAHFDICVRNASFYVDGQLIVDRERIVPEELR